MNELKQKLEFIRELQHPGWRYLCAHCLNLALRKRVLLDVCNNAPEEPAPQTVDFLNECFDFDEFVDFDIAQVHEAFSWLEESGFMEGILDA